MLLHACCKHIVMSSPNMLILTAACRLASTAKDTVIAFLAATLGTVIGTVAAWQAVGHLLGPDGWKVAAALCGSYVGGSVNFAAVSMALGLPPGPLLAAAMSADMVAMVSPSFPNLCPWNVLVDRHEQTHTKRVYVNLIGVIPIMGVFTASA